MTVLAFSTVMKCTELLLIIKLATLTIVSGAMQRITITNLTEVISGGSATVPHAAPWQAFLWVYKQNSEERHACEGAFIARNFVLTSAQCCEKARQVKIILGAYNLRTDENTRQTAFADFAYIHSRWKNAENDICVLSFPTQVLVNKDAQPIRLAARSHENLEKYTAVITSWTKDRTNLRSVNVPIVNRSTCQNYWKKKGYKLPESATCVNTTADQGFCTGKSGSPVVAYDKEGELRLVGIALSVIQACDNTPGFFTPIRKFLHWINKIVYRTRWEETKILQIISVE